MRPDMFVSLKALRSLDLIHRLGSFSIASSHLNITLDAMFKQVAELEKNLGIKLFEDKRRSTKLTGEGRKLIHAIGESFETINRALFEVVPVPGMVRLKVPQTFAISWLIPRLKSADRLKDVILVLAPEYEFRTADIEIKYTSGDQKTPLGIKVFDDVAVPVVSKTLFEPRKDLAAYVAEIGLVSGTLDCWDWRRYLSKTNTDSGFMLNAITHIADTDLTALQMASLGAGVGLINESFLAPPGDRSDVAIVSGFHAEKIGEYYAVCHNQRPETAAMLDFLKDAPASRSEAPNEPVV